MRRSPEERLRREIAALYDVLTEALGTEKVVMRAGKLGTLKEMRSQAIPDRLLALQRLVFEDPTLETRPGKAQYKAVINEIEDRLADLLAQRSVGDALEAKVNAKMVARHQEYLRELRLEALREDAGPETPATQRRLSELEALDARGLARAALDVLRPRALDQVVGQESAIKALIAKLASPYPQHVILYGPPGVGKTTVARLALELAKTRAHAPFAAAPPFVEAAGTTLRWDHRETTNPLLGSVHDPIYQGARRDFAEGGVPEPKLGLVTKAHGGVLFIDEIGEMDPAMQTRLLKVLEDKRVHFESSYYDELDPNVPAYVKKLFRDGAPADFVLIGATTRDPDAIDAAIRSRCAAVYFEPLTQTQVARIVREAAQRLGAKLNRRVADLIASYTIEGRKAVQILADAYGHALERAGGRSASVREEDVLEVVQAGRIVQHTPSRARRTKEIGKAHGLGVLQYVGSIVEIEAAAFPAREPRKGMVRFNDTAGSMARDAVFNAASVLRAITGTDPSDYDLHVNVVGGGNIDGPSAGLAFFLALHSALARVALPQDVAVTGEISLAGSVRGVGGVVEKLYAARQAGMRAIVIPRENARDIEAAPEGIDVIAVGTVVEAFAALGLRVPVPPAPRSRSRKVSR
ncbi:ATP-dependent protease, Lon family protein [Vulcanimicrobium alpinum]|uniref:endopeptidase La n=1 Tax=Vulcanimicrobium alpinum TaxID=3016050 RepID=A0AAN1XZT9_UNVUL|nr:Lon family ATP-dependent protease [Vulcanimicrobium alpinum]BDE07463.1 ATP-dependent protease, Lon family protein [Vulcanimicrobium alpinum]